MFQIKSWLQLLVRGLDVWQIRCVDTEEIEGARRIDFRLVREPRVKPPSATNPFVSGRAIAARDPVTRTINEALIAEGAGAFATATIISCYLKPEAAARVMADVEKFSLALRQASNRDNEDFPESFEDEGIAEKAAEIDREHGVIRGSAPIVAIDTAEYERRRNLIFGRVGAFLEGRPRIDRCPACGREVMIWRNPDPPRESNTAYIRSGCARWRRPRENQQRDATARLGMPGEVSS